MPKARVIITPRRTVTLYALLAVAMVIASYAVVLLLAAACVYLPVLLMIESRSGNLQMLALLVGGFAAAGAMLWSLVPKRVKFQAPGLPLERSEHPELFAELDDISATLNEPLPREVYLIGQVNAFVSDVGGTLGFGSRRILAIGLPLLAILNVTEVRGILAHEFGHYYSGDTRMGPWVYRAQTAMIRTFQNLGSLGSNVGQIAMVRLVLFLVSIALKWNFHFFLRVTNFVSRRKEFRADELACLVAGKDAVMEGMRKIHGGAMAWLTYWNTEVVPVLQEGAIPPVGDGFAKFLAAPQIAEHVSQGIEREMSEGKTSPYDTHPPLRARLGAIQTMEVAMQEQNGQPGLSLLNDPQATELRFLQSLNPELKKNPLRPVAWNEVGPLVTVPAWKAFVREHGSLLGGVCAEAIPRSLQDLPAIGSRLPDPKGMLLSPEQRTQRARHLVASSLGLALLEKGWQLENQPGSFFLHRGNETTDIFAVFNDLLAGKITEQAWKERCNEWGIAGMALSKPDDAPRS